jgi:hypothetical protein
MENNNENEIDPKKVENLHKLLAVFDTERLTPKDFIGAFKQVIEHVKGTQQLTVQHLKSIIAAVNTASQKHSEDTEAQLAVFRDDVQKHLQAHVSEIARLDAIISNIPTPKDGKDADEDVIIEKVLAKLPPTAAPLIGEDFRNHLEALPEADKLHISAIGGIEEFEKRIASKIIVPTNQGTGIATSTGNVARFQWLKFTGATVTQDSDTATITISSSGGFTALQSTETPDGTITVFTFPAATAQPSYIRSDNVLMKATSKSGTVNWTWDAGAKQATLTVPPQDDIEAVV